MNYGIIYDEPADVYHSTDCVGSHRLNDLSPYPLLFQKRWVTKEIPPDPPSPAMNFGAYFHCLSLEGESVAISRFPVAPTNIDRRTKEGKRAWEDFTMQHVGKTIIQEDDRDLAWRMVKAIREKPSAVALLAQGKPEVTFRHKMASFSIQARVDWFRAADGPTEPVIMDVKTVETLADFDHHFLKYGYYRQAAFYRLVVAKLLGIETFQPQFLYLVVEKSEPFQVAIRVPDANSLSIGTQEVMADLQRLKTCYETNTWPGEPDEQRGISLPDWKTKQALA
jgi:hypothetical protein